MRKYLSIRWYECENVRNMLIGIFLAMLRFLQIIDRCSSDLGGGEERGEDDDDINFTSEEYLCVRCDFHKVECHNIFEFFSLLTDQVLY